VTAGASIRSAARAARVLLHVAAAQGDGARATDVARALGLTVPTAHHLLSTLVAEGMLCKDTRRRYFLGHKVGILSDAFARQEAVPEHRIAALRELAGRTGQTAYLTAWRREEIAVLAIVESDHAVRAGRLHTGYKDHGHARSTGKVLLAYASADLRRAYLDVNPLKAVTPRTITDPAAFDAELERVRARGYAVEDEELREGLACVSAPLVEAGRVGAAVTVSAPAERFHARREHFVEAVLAAARQS
jgi:IclR family transcriptional regulator, acetate operon repressor